MVLQTKIQLGLERAHRRSELDAAEAAKRAAKTKRANQAPCRRPEPAPVSPDQWIEVQTDTLTYRTKVSTLRAVPSVMSRALDPESGWAQHDVSKPMPQDVDGVLFGYVLHFLRTRALPAELPELILSGLTQMAPLLDMDLLQREIKIYRKREAARLAQGTSHHMMASLELADEFCAQGYVQEAFVAWHELDPLLTFEHTLPLMARLSRAQDERHKAALHLHVATAMARPKYTASPVFNGFATLKNEIHFHLSHAVDVLPELINIRLTGLHRGAYYRASPEAGHRDGGRQPCALAGTDDCHWSRQLAMGYGSIGRFEEAVVYSAHHAEHDPLDVDTQVTLTDALLRLKKWPEARVALKRVQLLDTDSCWAPFVNRARAELDTMSA